MWTCDQCVLYDAAMVTASVGDEVITMVMG